MECVNLMERFGGRYKIGFDPVYDPKGRPRDKLDVWMMTIACERGTIYPYGNSRLAVDVDYRPVTAKRLAALDCCELVQDGDNEKTFAFDVAEFDAVAALVKPRRRRRASAVQRQKARESITALNRQKPVPDRSRRAQRGEKAAR